MRAGNSVLLIDQTDVYGSDDASFTLAGLMGSEDPQLNPNICSASGQLQQSDPGQPQLPSPAMQLVRIPPPALPISGVEVWSVPKTDLGNTRSYILDLAPKVRAGSRGSHCRASLPASRFCGCGGHNPAWLKMCSELLRWSTHRMMHPQVPSGDGASKACMRAFKHAHAHAHAHVSMHTHACTHMAAWQLQHRLGDAVWSAV